MRKALIGITAAAALAAGTAVVPTSANATPAWVVPALIGVGVGGLVIGATIAKANEPVVVGSHVATPPGPCRIETQIGPDGLPYQVQICPLQ